MLLASIVNSVVSPRQVSALRFDFENATVELDHLYGYTDHGFTVTAAAGIGDEVAAAWSEGPASQPSSQLAELAAVLDALTRSPLPSVALRTARTTLELVAAPPRLDQSKGFDLVAEACRGQEPRRSTASTRRSTSVRSVYGARPARTAPVSPRPAWRAVSSA